MYIYSLTCIVSTDVDVDIYAVGDVDDNDTTVGTVVCDVQWLLLIVIKVKKVVGRVHDSHILLYSQSSR